MATYERPGKKTYYLNIARTISERSTCLRRRYGAVIVKDDQIIATGYNGAPRGDENCCDVGTCYREQFNIPHGEQYEKCVAVHAENNAILSAGRNAIGATLYLSGYDATTGELLVFPEPCLMCSRVIKNAQIAEVICEGEGGYVD